MKKIFANLKKFCKLKNEDVEKMEMFCCDCQEIVTITSSSWKENHGNGIIETLSEDICSDCGGYDLKELYICKFCGEKYPLTESDTGSERLEGLNSCKNCVENFLSGEHAFQIMNSYIESDNNILADFLLREFHNWNVDTSQVPLSVVSTLRLHYNTVYMKNLVDDVSVCNAMTSQLEKYIKKELDYFIEWLEEQTRGNMPTLFHDQIGGSHE